MIFIRVLAGTGVSSQFTAAFAIKIFRQIHGLLITFHFRCKFHGGLSMNYMVFFVWYFDDLVSAFCEFYGGPLRYSSIFIHGLSRPFFTWVYVLGFSNSTEDGGHSTAAFSIIFLYIFVGTSWFHGLSEVFMITLTSVILQMSAAFLCWTFSWIAITEHSKLFMDRNCGALNTLNFYRRPFQ